MEHNEVKVPDPEVLRHFWQVQRSRAHLIDFQEQLGATALGTIMPGAWAYGGTLSEADDFVRAVLARGAATVTTPLAEYVEDDVPQVGTMSILCNGNGVPKALMVVDKVSIEPDPDTGQSRVNERLRVLTSTA